jgi:small-conductance mechanosensitive channel
MCNKFVNLIFVFALALMMSFQPANSQSSDGASSPSSQVMQKKIEEFASKLTKEEINILAKERLRELLTPETVTERQHQVSDKSFVESFKTGWQTYRRFLWNNITGFPAMVTGSIRAIAAIFSDRGFIGGLLFGGLFLVMLAIGLAAEFLVNRIARPWRDRIRDHDNQELTAMLKTLGLRVVVELAGLAAFMIAVLIAAQYLFIDPKDEFLATAFVLAVILSVRLMATFLRSMLAPRQSSLRLVSTDDWTAGFIYMNFIVLTGIIGVGLYILAVMNLFGIPGQQALRFWVGLYIFASIIYVTWRARHGLTSIIKGQDEQLTPGLERMAAWWPIISIIVMLIQYLVTQIGVGTGALDISPGTSVTTLAIVVLAPFMDTMLRGVIKHLVPPMQGEGPIAEAAYYETRHSYARIGRVLLFAILILIIGRIWGISFQNLAEAGVGAQLAAKLVGFLMVLAIGYLIWEATKLWINRRLANDMPVDGEASVGEGEGGGAGKSRMATVLPLISMTLQITIVTITILLALSQLGVNITPLLAGAGVLGLAVGFGAQTLVKDVVSGVFFLVDDAFRVGEFIDIGGTMGTVEKISVRSLQLRHPNGPVHIIPYGEIPKLTNNSRDYVIMKLRFTVPFNTDLEKVRKLFKKIGQEMMQNPAHAENFIQPFKSQGVADVDDVGIVIRGKFMTKPGAQWIIRKEIYSRVQKAFEENGIEFARKEVRVNIPGLELNADLDEKQKEAIAAAATSAASEVADSSAGDKGKKQSDPF